MQCGLKSLVRYFTEMTQLHLDLVVSDSTGPKVIAQAWIDSDDLNELVKGRGRLLREVGLPVITLQERIATLFVKVEYLRRSLQESATHSPIHSVIQSAVNHEDKSPSPIHEKVHTETQTEPEILSVREREVKHLADACVQTDKEHLENTQLADWKKDSLQLMDNINMRLSKMELPELPSIVKLAPVESHAQNVQALDSQLPLHLYKCSFYMPTPSVEGLDKLTLPTTMYILARISKVTNFSRDWEGVLSMDLLGAVSQTESLPLHPGASLQVNLEHTLPLAITRGFLQRYLSEEPSPVSVHLGSSAVVVPWTSLLSVALQKKIVHQYDQAVCSVDTLFLEENGEQVACVEMEVWIGEWNALSAVRRLAVASLRLAEEEFDDSSEYTLSIEQVLGLSGRTVQATVDWRTKEGGDVQKYRTNPSSSSLWNTSVIVKLGKDVPRHFTIHLHHDLNLLGSVQVSLESLLREDVYGFYEFDEIKMLVKVAPVMREPILTSPFKLGSLNKALDELETTMKL